LSKQSEAITTWCDNDEHYATTTSLQNQ